MKRQLAALPTASRTTKQTKVPRAGRIVRVDDRGRLWVDLGDGAKPQLARVSASLARSNLVVGDLPFREVLLAADTRGNPVVIDFVEDRLLPGRATQEAPSAPQDEAVLDADRLLMRGKEQIVLSCGKATITLTRAGKIIIRGAYVSTNSSGVNRIRGGSVQLN